MNGPANSQPAANLTATPATPSLTSAAGAHASTSWNDAQRLAVQLVDTGVMVATLERGRLTLVAADESPVSPFFTYYALPAYERIAATVTNANAGVNAAEVQLQLDVPGVVACALPPSIKRVNAGPSNASAASAKENSSQHAAIVLLARRDDFDASNEDLQRLCGALKLDRQWLAAEARRATGVTPPLLARLARLAWTSARNEVRLGGLVVERDALSGQLAETYEELTLIYQISGGMRVNRSVDDFFRQACTDVIDVMSVRAAGYAVVNAAAGCAESSALFGDDVVLDEETSRILVDELLARFRTSPRSILINDVRQDAFAALRALAEAGIRRLVAVPIQRQDKVLGALFCLDKHERDFTTQDSKLLASIANETAIYLENNRLFSDARGMMMGLLHALTSAVESKDSYTCGHSQRVALFGREIATAAGMPEAFCERVYMAGLLHDVGKIGVPEDVLRKPGKLTDDEFGLMKKHVDIGAHILRDVRQIEDLIPGVLHHHERYDGKGYPMRLAGQDVPTIARILCVADCFDAMTSNRTYRKALPIEVALMEIRRCAGTQFDPMLADAFLSIGAEKLRDIINSVTDQTAVRLAA